jgi:selenocysteine-specific elongation factor
LEALLGEAGFAGARLSDLAARLNLPAKVADRSMNLLATRGAAILFEKAERLAISKTHFEGLCARAEKVVVEFTAAHDLKGGVSREQLRNQLADDVSPKLLARVLEELVRGKKLELEGDLVRSPGSKPTRAGSKDNLLARVQEALGKAGLAPPRVGELAEQLKAALPQVQDALRLLRAEGLVVRVKDDMYFEAQAITTLRERVVAHLREKKEMDIQAFKDLVGQTRKYTVPLGEYFDQERLTLRVGEKRVLRGDTSS